MGTLYFISQNYSTTDTEAPSCSALVNVRVEAFIKENLCIKVQRALSCFDAKLFHFLWAFFYCKHKWESCMVRVKRTHPVYESQIRHLQ